LIYLVEENVSSGVLNEVLTFTSRIAILE